MKKIGFASIITSGLAALFIGLAAPAQAGQLVQAPAILPINDGTVASSLDHIGWLNDIQPKVNVPQVDTSPRNHNNR